MPTAGVIAIDGPAASGKSTLACRLAERLGYLYFDTGVMYRAVTLTALERNIPVEEEAAISQLAQEIDIDVETAPGAEPPYRVLVNGRDVTDQLRDQRVDDNVSQVSLYPQVRSAMTALQRAIGLRGQVVMVGRDIGTVVLPEADLKIYLDASVEARAHRRWLELEETQGEAEYAEVLASMKARDEIDSSRSVAPLKAAEDAIRLDNTGLSIEATVDQAVELAESIGS
jgi:cytidylate kinase